MPSLQITTKIGCNNACTYCPQEKLITAYSKRSSARTMSFSNFRECIDKLSPDVDVWFAGMSEPWLNPDCTEMLLYAHQKGHTICVSTTLAGMELSDVDLLESVPFGFFKIHVLFESAQDKVLENDNYLNVLDRILKSNINVSFHCHGKNPYFKVKTLLDYNKKSIEFRSLYQRSGNIKIKGRMNLARKRGAIGCRRNLRCNVLLPNGDVVLCSNDYEMKHVLGNLFTSSWESLFVGDEFTKIKKGQQDESIDILCRNCNNFCYDTNLSAKIYNFPHQLDRYIYYIRDLRSIIDINVFMKKILCVLRKR